MVEREGTSTQLSVCVDHVQLFTVQLKVHTSFRRRPAGNRHEILNHIVFTATTLEQVYCSGKDDEIDGLV